MITLWDGSRKPIEQIVRGDQVLSFTADGRLVPGLVTDLLTNITTQWVQLSNGMIVTPWHLFARPHGGFMSIADVLRLDGQILDVHGQVQTVTGSWIHYSADTAEQFETAAVQVLPQHGSTALEPQMVVGWRTYNFTVSDTHTYIAHDVRVHNDSQWQERYEAYLAERELTQQQMSYETWKVLFAVPEGPPVGPNADGSEAPIYLPIEGEGNGLDDGVDESPLLKRPNSENPSSQGATVGYLNLISTDTETGITSNQLLVSEGIYTLDGITVIDSGKEGLPNFGLPTLPGMTVHERSVATYHKYELVDKLPDAIQGDEGLAAVEQALIANPTPGVDAPASINGTLNDVGALLFPLSNIADGGTNLAVTFLVANPDPDQSDFIVNVTMGKDHIARDGTVIRYAQKEEDGSISIVTIGEGNSLLQYTPGLEQIAEWAAEDAWDKNADEIAESVINSTELQEDFGVY